MRRPLAVLTVAGALAAPAAIAMTGPSILLSPNPVHRGHKVRVHGTAPGCQGSLTLLSNAFPATPRADTRPAGRGPPPARRGALPPSPTPPPPPPRSGAETAAPVPPPRGTKKKKPPPPGNPNPRRYNVTGRCGGGTLGVTAHL